MRHTTARALAHILTFKCGQTISEPRRRLIRAMVSDYLEWNPQEGFGFQKLSDSQIIAVEKREKFGEGFSAEVIGFCFISD